MRVKGQSLLAAPSCARAQGSDQSRATSSRAPCRKSRGSIPPCCVRRGPQGIVPITRAPLPPPRPRAGPQAGSASWPVGPQQCVPHRQGAPVVSGGCGARTLTSPPAVAMATASPARASEPPVSWQPPDLRSPSTGTGPRVALASKRRQWAVPAAGGGVGRGLRGAGRGVAACGRRRRGADMRRGPGGGSSVGGGGAKGRRRSRASSRTGGVPGRAHRGRRR